MPIFVLTFFFLTFGDSKTSKSTDFQIFEFRQKRRNFANKKTKAETKIIIIITQLSVIDDVGSLLSAGEKIKLLNIEQPVFSLLSIAKKLY
jgi:hypothetical protein